MHIKILGENEFVLRDGNICISEKESEDTIYIIPGEATGYYRCFLDAPDDSGLFCLVREVALGGTYDGEMKIFIQRARYYNEPLKLEEFSKKFPMVSQFRIEYALCRALSRMNLKETEDRIITAVIAGRSIRELLNKYPLEEILSTLVKVNLNIPNYCFSDYEKKYLMERVSSFGGGQLEFLHTTDSFCENFGFSESLIKQITAETISKQNSITDEEKEFLISFFNEREYSQLSGEEKTRAGELVEIIIEGFKEDKRSYLEEVVSRRDLNEILALVAALPKEYRHELSRICRHSGITAPRPCEHHKSKKISDYLE